MSAVNTHGVTALSLPRRKAEILQRLLDFVEGPK
jgi:hypothetical protein